VHARTAFAAASAVVILVGIAAVVAWRLWDAAPEPSPEPETETAAAPAATKTGLRRVSRHRAAEVPDAGGDADAEIRAAWDAAVAQYKEGKPIEALTSLVRWRKERPAWFAEPARAALLAEMERAALALLAKAARSGSLEEARRLAAALKAALLDAELLEQVSDLAAAAERRWGAAQMASGADVIAHADLLSDKQALSRHLQRFADRGPAPKTKDWVDNQIAAVAARNAALTKEPDPLAVPDPAEAEQRRLDQLEKLRKRNATGLLDSIDGALAWLALHQADDGHFGADASVARCKAMKHDPACVASANEPYPLASTGLAVLAFLDFRDQDVKRLFEPTLSRGVQWIAAQQQPDGSFGPKTATGYQKGYAWAIGLMALGQAASTSRDPALKKAVQRGIDFYAKHHGPEGGYWYVLDPQKTFQQDLSVTGWYVQAWEAATNAGANPPEEMKTNLDRFLSYVWIGEHKFAYRIGETERASLSPVGMLSMAILRPQSPQWYGDKWRESLATSRFISTYWLYYGVRVQLFLDGKVSDKVRGYLNELAAKQVKKGAGAGAIPLDAEDQWKKAGPTMATAFATLILEHSLYRR
jgi:hypothetical protein